MSKIRAVLVDDEESARDVLQNLLLRFCPDVTVIAKCANVTEAVAVIEKEQPDLVFLDIEMPQYAGFEIVRFFTDIRFEIIFVTAYDQYAVRAFEMAAIDYLLKPIDIERLKLAVNRVLRQQDIEQQAQRLTLLSSSLENKTLKNIVVSDKGQQHIIPVERLIAIEAQESYCILHTAEKKYIASKNLKHFENILSTLPRFFRVHKSWIINKDFLKNYSRSELTIQLSNGLTTKLSKYKKAEFEADINA